MGAAAKKQAQSPPTPAVVSQTKGLAEKTDSNVASNQPARAARGLRTPETTAAPVAEFSFDSDVKVPTHSIIVGEVKASYEPLKVTTLLGSCVGVCLYDPKARVGGMNHFMLPSNCTSDGPSATYGIHAMELLINEIMKLGGDRRRLTAKVFGGGDVLGKRAAGTSGKTIGEQNIEFALQFLETDSIPVIAQDIGGLSGRQVQFLTHTGQAFVRPVQKVDENCEQAVTQMRRRSSSPAEESSRVVLF
jgi:chemotaxis receptor (MCP) glutamine deamidase CheD